MDPTQVDELKHMGQLKHGGRVKDQVMSVSLYNFLSYRNLSTCQINMQHSFVSWMAVGRFQFFFSLSFLFLQLKEHRWFFSYLFGEQEIIIYHVQSFMWFLFFIFWQLSLGTSQGFHGLTNVLIFPCFNSH